MDKTCLKTFIVWPCPAVNAGEWTVTPNYIAWIANSYSYRNDAALKLWLHQLFWKGYSSDILKSVPSTELYAQFQGTIIFLSSQNDI